MAFVSSLSSLWLAKREKVGKRGQGTRRNNTFLIHLFHCPSCEPLADVFLISRVNIILRPNVAGYSHGTVLYFQQQFFNGPGSRRGTG